MVKKYKYLLGICFLQEWRPENVVLLWLEEDKPSIDCGESIVNQNLSPVAAPPQTKSEHASIVVTALYNVFIRERLIRGNNAVK